jgi:hypothetical protein
MKLNRIKRVAPGALCFCCALFFQVGFIRGLHAETRAYDVVVAGAGTGGTSAAITAARMGSRVALLEESDWIGGQASAAAVSTMDEGKNLTPPSGLYGELTTRLEAYYRPQGKSVATCYWGNGAHCYEPSAVRKVFNDMIAEINSNPGSKGRIDVFLRERVVRVLSSASTVTGVVTQHGATLQSKILIDATEYGDVLPLTPARFRRGRSIGIDSKESCTQDITYAMVIKKYPNGVPKELQMQHTPPEYEKWLPTLKAQWRADGNPNRDALPVNFANHNAYRGLPDSSNPESYVSTESRQITRTVLNWFNDFPVHTDIFDRNARKAILCEAKLKTLANLYYLQHELNESLWSVANDEGFDTEFNRTENSCPNIPEEFRAIEQNFPVLPYIRESQRLVGEYTLTAGDIRRERQGAKSVVGFADAIAVGDYADDLHRCASERDLEPELEHLSDRPGGFRMGPFEVPLRSLIPEKVDGLLAAEKNISQSRMANGATRLQPITMLTGQAAGTLAYLAISKGIQPRAVNAEEVQIALLRAGSILAREPMPDMAMGTRPWQAAQFAVTRQWMTAFDTGFASRETVSRGEAAAILARAFGRVANASGESDSILHAKSVDAKATYEDVPLYSPISAAVEEWRERASIPTCKLSANSFCPDAVLTTGEFIAAVAAFKANKPDAGNDARLHRNVEAKDSDALTRADAAIVLYNTEP